MTRKELKGISMANKDLQKFDQIPGARDFLYSCKDRKIE